jgi:hypothetical protein
LGRNNATDMTLQQVEIPTASQKEAPLTKRSRTKVTDIVRANYYTQHLDIWIFCISDNSRLHDFQLAKSAVVISLTLSIILHQTVNDRARMLLFFIDHTYKSPFFALKEIARHDEISIENCCLIYVHFNSKL